MLQRVPFVLDERARIVWACSPESSESEAYAASGTQVELFLISLLWCMASNVRFYIGIDIALGGINVTVEGQTWI